MNRSIEAIIFDLGGVLIDWNPRYVYRKIFKTEEEVEWFLENVTTLEWNENQDAGFPLHKATEELIAKHPEWEPEIKAYYGRWIEMLGDAIHETVEILQGLKQTSKYKLYALTNWSAETFPHALERFEFFKLFDGVVVSGEEKMRKPFPEFYQRLLSKFNLKPSEALFIDDNLRNVKAAEQIGIKGIFFQSPAQLKKDLRALNIMFE
ncbi:MAG TPA: HAD family phosphatase [Chitinophagaceae bacterium]|jgi:2-haloacid dehalogenase|nr:HAD family phosphatase [Chitinophagaceae bacterium]